MSNLVRIKLLKFPANFSSKFGSWQFENGVSEPMPRREAERLSAVTSVEFLDGAETIQQRRRRERGEVMAKITKTPVKQAPEPAPEPESKAPRYSRETLEAVADKEGTPGLRKIADEFDVKGRSIRDLIDAIMKAQVNA